MPRACTALAWPRHHLCLVCSHCLSVAKTPPLHGQYTSCDIPLPSRLRHRLSLALFHRSGSIRRRLGRRRSCGPSWSRPPRTTRGTASPLPSCTHRAIKEMINPANPPPHVISLVGSCPSSAHRAHGRGVDLLHPPPAFGRCLRSLGSCSTSNRLLHLLSV